MVYFKGKGIYFIGNQAYQNEQDSYLVTTANQIWCLHWQSYGQEGNLLGYLNKPANNDDEGLTYGSNNKFTQRELN